MTLKNNKCVEILSHGKGQPRSLCGPQMGSASPAPPTPRAPAPRPNPVPRSSAPGRRLAGRDGSRPQDKPSATTGRKALATPPTGPAPAHCRPSRSPPVRADPLSAPARPASCEGRRCRRDVMRRAPRTRARQPGKRRVPGRSESAPSCGGGRRSRCRSGRRGVRKGLRWPQRDGYGAHAGPSAAGLRSPGPSGRVGTLEVAGPAAAAP